MESMWTDNEFFSADLGDARLNKRLSIISHRFAQSPLSPINHACDDWAETKAAYRFFRNDTITYCIGNPRYYLLQLFTASADQGTVPFVPL